MLKLVIDNPNPVNAVPSRPYVPLFEVHTPTEADIVIWEDVARSQLLVVPCGSDIADLGW